MRTRLVIWGTNADDEKVLLGISLNVDDNKIEINIIPEKFCTEHFYNQMMSQWREGASLEMPSETVQRIIELTMSESILPEDLRVERTDVIQRAQMEWHFVVLSSKLYRNFKNDLEELSNKIKRLEVYDNDLWNELKQFWEHVQKHIYDKNLLRDHSDSLREKSNSLFEELKKLRKVYANEFAQRSKETASGFIKKLEKIEERINNGSALQPLFNELKDIQSEYKALTLTKEDRDLIFVRIDQLFNLIREKREHKTKSGTNHETNTEERINKRYKGLIQVIRTMEGSISRDRKDIEYETKRIQTTTEQLESQIRVAKIRMIEDRIRSKQEKLEELLKTKVSLEKVAENIKKRAERQEQKNLDNARLKEEENKIKAKITNEIQTAQEAIQVEEEKLLQAAAKIKEGRRNKKIVLENKDQSDIQNSKAQNTLDDQLENKTDISNPLTEEEKKGRGIVNQGQFMISKEVIIGSNPLTLKEIEGILFNKYKISLSDKAVKAVSDSYQFLINFSKGKLIYGINTGFGPMAQYKIGEENLKKLQYNLIRSHCAGTGELLTDLDTKALMIARLNSLMLGYSGVHTDLVNLLMQLINKNVFPLIYQHGGVGASGDLVQLAHLALALIGEGQVKYKGSIINTDLFYKKEKLKALSIYKREGIAVLNGTSAMTGIGCINLIYSKKLLNWAIILSTLINEIAEAYDDHFSKELNQVKRHDGQNYVANKMRVLSQGSQLIKRRSEVLYNKQIDDPILIDKVQEYYSLRCVPQILGPIFETILKAEEVLINEINSVNDNPIIDKKNKDVYHGGNFHGDYVALEMDKLKIAITKLSMLSERQLNYLLNDKLNQKLTPFLNLGTLGLNYGLQGMQFTATSTVAESQTLSMPNYIHSIPNNNDNQDIVSMGTNGSLLTRKVIDNAFEILAIHTIAVMQAIDVIECSKKLSPKGLNIYKSFRKVCTKTIDDKPLSNTIGNAIIFLKESNLSDI